MANIQNPPKLAVLIDADNASSKVVKPLFEEIAKLGDASIRRIYGDFSSDRSKAWASVLTEHAIVPQQQYAYTTGKNASDITLVIDAMDILLSGRVDGFCLVSSDSDFTRLASRIREQRLQVYGFGEQKTPRSLQQACDRFIFTENLFETSTDTEQPSTVASKPLLDLKTITPNIRKAIEQVEAEDGWANLGTVGQQLTKLDSSFDPRSDGKYTKLIELVRATYQFEIDHPEGKSPNVRIKQSKRP